MATISYYSQSFPVKDGQPDPTQTLALVESLLASNVEKVIIYFSSLHFGTDDKGRRYLHFNDQNVSSLEPFFHSLAVFLKPFSKEKVEFRVMLGGAGGAYAVLFEAFDVYYSMLQSFLVSYQFISGIDLDVEEMLDTDESRALVKIQKLISRIHTDTHGFMERERGFAITMAPVASSLTSGGTGMGGFSYKKLLKSNVGKQVSGLNVQFYGCFSEETFRAVVENGFPTSMITAGMLGDDYGASNALATAMSTLEGVETELGSLQGIVLWEAGDTKIDPYQWGREVMRASGKKKPVLANTHPMYGIVKFLPFWTSR